MKVKIKKIIIPADIILTSGLRRRNFIIKKRDKDGSKH